MDCVIPGHSYRAFTGAIQCLSKIGKDLYLDFDPLDGLALRALNDAKSAFCVVEFGPSFFERCTTPVVTTTSTTASSNRKRSHASTSTQSTSGTQDTRFSVRVPMKALAPVVRPRKNIVTVRIKSEGHAGDTAGSNNDNASLLLAFEFQLEVHNHSSDSGMSNNDYGAPSGVLKPTWCKVIHRMGVAEVDNISAVAPKDECSELVAAPKMLQKWLEPINRTNEACLIFTKDADLVVATSFNSTDTVGLSAMAVAASSSSNTNKRTLKTETCIQLQDLQDFDFRDNRQVPSSSNSDGEGEEEWEGGMPPTSLMPENVNDEVVLVFGIKEAKAFLQYCAQQASASSNYRGGGGGWNNNNHDDSMMMDNNNNNNSPWSVALSFHWAGRPLIWESKAGSVSVQLVLATLAHNILKDLPMMKKRVAQSQPIMPQQRQNQHRGEENRRHSAA